MVADVRARDHRQHLVIRVLVIEDHPVVRAGFETVLRLEPGFVCVGAIRPRDQRLLAGRVTADVVLGTAGPISPIPGATVVIDDASDLPALFDRVRLAARAAQAAA
jgi:DNA-binding NarL/FixJ family response regulator